jgi:transposase
MISEDTLKALEAPDRDIPYILGTRMRKVKEGKDEVLSRAGNYREVYPEGNTSKDPSPLKVKEVELKGNRYIVCLNVHQARKDAEDRKAIIASLEEKIERGPKALVGNKGYRKYLKLERGSVSIDTEKVRYDSRFDGKWVLKTNMEIPSEQVALKYKELWQVERAFRDVKTLLETRPVYHKCADTIRGHVFCSFLVLQRIIL